MDKKMKHNYLVPSVKVVSFKVEMGQAASPLNVGRPDTGIEPFENNQSWAARPYTPIQLNEGQE